MRTKSELLGSLEVHSNNVRLSRVLQVLARGHDLATPFRSIVADRAPQAFDRAIQLLESREALVYTADHLYLLTVRAAVTESFELVRDYCGQTNQFNLMQSQGWFHVFRLIRNCLNHSFRFDFRKGDLARLPLQWRSIRLSAELDGQELTQATLPPDVAMEWLEELERFLDSEVR